MSNQELLIGGVKKEDPAIDPKKFSFYLGVSGFMRMVRRISITGGEYIPRTGSAVVVFAPHTSLWDPPISCYTIAREAKRTTKYIAADYVVNPNIPQDPVELKRTGKSPHPKWRRWLISYIANFNPPISYNRSSMGKEAEDEIKNILKNNKLLAISLQETRVKTTKPNPANIGAAKTALLVPETPIVLVGITGAERLFGPIQLKFKSLPSALSMGLDPNERKSQITLHNKIIEAMAPLVSPEAAKNMARRDKSLL
jgi:hypothetical protein